MLDDWAEALDDPDDGPVVWLALAATQWKVGRLEPRVQQRALDIISSGEDLKRWESATDRRKRAEVLAKLQTELLSPQRPPVKIGPPLRTTTPLQTGDAATYRLDDGRMVILRVVGVVGDERDNYPIVEVADWIGEPPVPDPAGVPGRRPVRMGFPALISLVQHRRGEYPADRVRVIAQGLPVTRRLGPETMIAWPRLAQFLSDTFGLA